MPQDRADLATGLKRQGYRTDLFNGLESGPDLIHDEDYGVLVIPESDMQVINKRFGLSLEFSQITLWFNHGSYFKGTLQSTATSHMDPGFYGGLKRPKDMSPGSTTMTMMPLMR